MKGQKAARNTLKSFGVEYAALSEKWQSFFLIIRMAVVVANLKEGFGFAASACNLNSLNARRGFRFFANAMSLPIFPRKYKAFRPFLRGIPSPNKWGSVCQTNADPVKVSPVDDGAEDA